MISFFQITENAKKNTKLQNLHHLLMLSYTKLCTKTQNVYKKERTVSEMEEQYKQDKKTLCTFLHKLNKWKKNSIV